ncbi:MAG: ATP-NAD kinase family protein [Rhizobiales bacterium]|nr:ATP-NAD kinase family protein [Hyphomicrobiales bacterium]
MTRRFRLGLIVNPLAGMGGRVGLKGTDGRAEEALKLGARPSSNDRAVRALKRLAASHPSLTIVAAHGAMGQDAANETRFLAELTTVSPGAVTTASDTVAAAREMHSRNVDLILFSGGDGTARDVFEAVGDDVPMLGIPAGVKMQSGVFATSPEIAGEIVAALAAMPDRAKVTYRASEVMDVDEDLLRQDAISPRLYGYARVPHFPLRLQNAKARQHALDEAAVSAAARRLAAGMDRDCLYAVGAGRTAKRVIEALGEKGTLLGTDLVENGKIVARDANEKMILERASERPLKLIVGVVGGHGYVLGRGNQELSPDVIRRAGRDNITIIASQEKLMALPDKRLLVETGDGALDRELAGYWRVVVGPTDEMVMKMVAA